MDDVLNVSGHRMGTAEVESALVLHPAVAEAAVVGYPHDVKGQGIYCFVTLMQGTEGTDELRQALEQMVRTEIGAIANRHPSVGTGLAKNAFRQDHAPYFEKIAENELDQLGDTSTLADPSVVDDLIQNSPTANQ